MRLLIGTLILTPTIVLAETLTWDYPAQEMSNIKQFNIYDQRKLIKSVPAPTVSAKVTIKPATNYIYEATAVDKQGRMSDYSNALIVTPPPVPTLPSWPPAKADKLRINK